MQDDILALGRVVRAILQGFAEHGMKREQMQEIETLSQQAGRLYVKEGETLRKRFDAWRNSPHEKTLREELLQQLSRLEHETREL